MKIVPLKEDPAEPFVYSLEVKRDYDARVRYESPPALPAEHLRVTLTVTGENSRRAEVEATGERYEEIVRALAP